MEEIIVRYIHFLGILTLAATLVGEHLLIASEVELKSFKKLVLIDGVYGFSAIMILISGLVLWFGVGKPDSFYSYNVIFHIKLTLFVLIGILSAFPTYYFIRNRSTTSSSILIPKYIINIIRIEVIMLILMPLLAVLMAHGVGNT